MPNDPNVIESSHLREDCPESQRKPDIIGIFESYLCRVDSKLGKKSFREIADIIKEDGIEQNLDEELEWTDVQQTVELKVKDRNLGKPQREWNLKKVLADVNEEMTSKSRKRTRNTDDEGSNSTTTKTKTSHGSRFHGIHTSILPDPAPDQKPLPTITTEIQDAYYGIERLCSTWHSTHSTTIVVEGFYSQSTINLYWF